MTTQLVIVDDQHAFRSMLTEYFTMQGYQVDWASHGQEAMADLARSDTHYQCVLTDIYMPIMDGVSLAGYTQQLYPTLPVIAMTAAPSETTNPRYLDSLFAAVLRKPFYFSAVLHSVQQLRVGLGCCIPQNLMVSKSA